MPRYFFEVYNACAAEWDVTGSECSNRREIERTARQRFAAFLSQHASNRAPLCLAVLAAGGSVVMTAAGIAPDEMQVFWR